MSRIARAAGRVTRKSRPRSTAPEGHAGVSLTLRIDLGSSGAIGPGKIRLLELVGETGSISAAGRAMGMSYRQAWLLIDSLNGLFGEPATKTLAGGAKGGGADLTVFGQTLIRTYRTIEAAAEKSTADELALLADELAAKGTSSASRAERAAKTGSRKTRS